MQKKELSSALKLNILCGMLGTAIGAGTLLLISLFSLKAEVDKACYPVLFAVVSFVCGAVPGFILSRKKKRNGIVNGLSAAMIPAVALLLAMSIAAEGFYAAECVPAAICFWGGITGGICAVNIKAKKKRAINRRK